MIDVIQIKGLLYINKLTYVIISVVLIQRFLHGKCAAQFKVNNG